MAINYTIQAEIIDITADTPKTEDVFLVDTNIWYWMTYPNATSLIPSQLSDYPKYLKNALIASSKVYHSGLSLAELSHLIERTEREIYEKSVIAIKPKEYRHNLSGERARVVSEIRAAWGQIASMTTPLAVTIDALTINAAFSRLQTDTVDGYDLFLLESMRNHGVVQVITDDGDYATVSDIKVFTANRNVIQAAKTQGQLLKR